MSWYSDSFLLANPDKFQAITITSRGQSTDGSERDIILDINGYTVQSTSETKLLGVYFDDLSVNI